MLPRPKVKRIRRRRALASVARSCHAGIVTALFRFECTQPWLVARFAAPQRMLSWSLNRPGFVDADRVAWLEVRDADLPLGRDPRALLETRLAAAGHAGAVGLMTARDVRRHACVAATVEDVVATALATVGLTNGVAFARDGWVVAPGAAAPVGTINLLVALSCRIADAALIEAVAIAATARTAALLAAGGVIAATGTDCIVLACPLAGPAAPHAGLHTAVGRALAAAVHGAIAAARAEWDAEFR